MKITNPENLLTPLRSKQIKGALLYGENSGYIYQSSRRIQDYLGATKEKIEVRSIVEDNESFCEKIRSRDLFMKKRVFFIGGIKKTDKINKKTIEKIENSAQGVFVLLISYEQSIDASLKKSFEDSEQLLCIAHYPDDKYQSLNIIKEEIKKNNLKLCSNAQKKLLSKLLFQDRLIIKSEIKKLCQLEQKLNEEEIDQCVTTIFIDNSYISNVFDNINNKEKLIKALLSKIEADISAIQIINMMFNYCKKLIYAKRLIKNNYTKEFIFTKLRIHFTAKKSFSNHIDNNSEEKINFIMSNLINLELLCKKNYKSQNHILINKISSIYSNE